jgi:hypothetical protein
VAHHQNQLGAQLATAELQAANHAAFRMGASVACIPQDKQVTWHGIKNWLEKLKTESLRWKTSQKNGCEILYILDLDHLQQKVWIVMIMW